MTLLDSALSLAAQGFYIFPCRVNSKLPVHKGWQDRATRDETQIRKWWGNHDYNIGIFTSKFKDDQSLVVVDIDTKKGKRGDESILNLELSGSIFPTTIENSTPSGGRHLVYSCATPLRQGTDVIGSGLDIRSKGGYIVGPGSSLDGKFYQQINGYSKIAQAPDWLVERLGADHSSTPVDRTPLHGVDPDRASHRAVEYLKSAPIAVENNGGNFATYKVAAHVKDLGCTADQATMLMDEHWNERCDPPWSLSELNDLVRHAYQYGREQPGSAAPEAVFPPPAPWEKVVEGKEHPFAELNKEFAFVKAGAFILQETTDPKGNFTTEHLSLGEFHGWHANVPFQTGNQKPRPISEHWMSWANRRQYEGVVFMPEKDAGPRWYNLWRGFTTPSSENSSHPSVRAFIEHARLNVCGGDEKLFNWLMGYFAHMIQKPWEKPLVALVFKGKKGTGKNALVERVGHLLGSHFLVADDERYLLSNFNSHLESNLFFVLDEAAWAGDKKAEGRLKGLITGQQHNIERKGKEPYRVDNLTRVAIIGNEDWLVPASQDERRFAVFHIGEGRIQDRAFFEGMRKGMEQGGYACLLKYLMDFDLSTVDVNDAPKTQALVDQKHASLDIVQQWWLDCLSSGQIAGGDWGGEWPEACPTNRLREALGRWARNRNIRSRLPEEVGFGRIIHTIAPSFKKKKARPDKPNDTSYSFFSPGIDRLRKDWNHYIGGEVVWQE